MRGRQDEAQPETVRPDPAATVVPNRQVTVEPQADDRSGSVGRYPVTGKLGAGGMGEVLLVWDAELGRELAVKVALAGGCEAEKLERLILEARVTGQLEHPNIVPVHELGRVGDGRVYFTMQRVRGRTLAEVLQQEPPPSLVELLHIFQKVCDALRFAHDRGVIHRDIKPANIMVGQFGEVQVMDWGLAKLLGEDEQSSGDSSILPVSEVGGSGTGSSSHTLDGSVLGTPAYMAPEQARGRIRELDRRTDVYALGAILYEMLAGCAPYCGATAQEILQQVRAGSLMPPGRRAPERRIPWELETVVLRAMAHQPAERYPDVGALAADVARFLEGRVLAAADYSLAQRAGKWVGRNRTLFFAGLLVGLAGVAAAAVSYINIQRRLAEQRDAREAAELGQARERALKERARDKEGQARRQLSQARLRLAQALIFKADVALRERGVLEAAAYIAAAGKLAPRTPVIQAARFALPSPVITLERIIAGGGPFRQLAWSPDGRQLAAAGGQQQPLLWDAQNWRRIPLQGSPGNLTSVAFSPDGRLLAAGQADGRIVLWDLAARRARRTLSGHTKAVRCLAFSYARGERLLASGGNDCKTRVWNVATGEGRVRIDHGRWPVGTVAFSPDGRLLAAGDDIRRVQVIDLERSAWVWNWVNQTYLITSLDFSADGKLLAIGSNSNDVGVWRTTDWTRQARLTGHRSLVSAVAFMRQGEELLTTSADGTLKLWDVAGGALLRSVPCRMPGPGALALAPGERTAATAGGGLLQIWRIQRGVRRRRRVNHPQPILAARYGPHGRLFATGSYDRTAQILDVQTGRPLQSLVGHRDQVGALDFSPDGRLLATGSMDHTARLWEVAGGRPSHVLQGHSNHVVAVAFSRDGRALVTASPDKTLRWWDVASGRCLRVVRTPQGAVTAFAFSANGRTLAAARADGQLLLFSAAGGVPRTVAIAPGVLALAWVGQQLALALYSGKIELIDPFGRQPPLRLAGHTGSVNTVAYSPVSGLLASGASDSTIKLWDPRSGEFLRTLASGYDYKVASVGFAPDGRSLLAIGSHATDLLGFDTLRDPEAVQRFSGLAVEELELTPISSRAHDALRARVRPCLRPLWPVLASDFINRGIVRYVERQFHPDFLAESLRYFERATRIEPRNWQAWFWRARALAAQAPAAQGSRDEARAAFERARELAPSRYRALIGREMSKLLR